MQENECPGPTKYCEVALKQEKQYGEICAQLSAGTEIMRSLKASQEEGFERLERLLEKQDQRITSVEKRVWWASGAASTVSAAVTFIMTYLKFKGPHG
jgi:hypothetical protein